MPGECYALIALISATGCAVGCVTAVSVQVSDASVLQSPMLLMQEGMRRGWPQVDFWKTLGYGQANEGLGVAPTPDRAWIPMGQQLGLPAARATQREVLGAGVVEPFTLGRGSDWLRPPAAKICRSAGRPNFAFRTSHSFRNYCTNQSLTTTLRPPLIWRCCWP